MTGWLFALSGAAAGAAEAGLLAQTAKGRAGPLSLIVRLGLVGGALFLAARGGFLLQGTAGWLLGLGTSAGLLYRRLR